MKQLYFLLSIFWLLSCNQPGTVTTIPCPCPCDSTVVQPPLDTSGRAVLFGVNTNHWQPKEKQAAMQGVRLYFPIGWGFTEKGFYGQPLKQAQKQFLGLDDYLQFMKTSGSNVLLCLMQSPDWLNGHTEGWGVNSFPPIRPGLDRKNPSSYAEIAGIYKAFAIRYGSKVWPKGSYKIDPAPPRWNGDERQIEKSGLNLVTYIEVGNELDRWWKIGTDEYMAADEHAAFLIACFDSIKAADPSIKVVLGGLTNYDLAYLNSMKAFCDSKGRKFPADIINVHHYSNTANEQGVHPPPQWLKGCAPELDKDMASLSKIVSFSKAIGLPCWVTEYGYDTDQSSPMYPQVFGGNTSDQLQAKWNVRSSLEMVRLGASRVYCFTIADEPNPGAGLFTSCGLLQGEPKGYAEKPSYQEFISMTNELKGFKYISDESTPTVRIMKFANAAGDLNFAFWLPTASNATQSLKLSAIPVMATETVQYLRFVKQ